MVLANPSCNGSGADRQQQQQQMQVCRSHCCVDYNDVQRNTLAFAK
jgi:hypothetical protein